MDYFEFNPNKKCKALKLSKDDIAKLKHEFEHLQKIDADEEFELGSKVCQNGDLLAMKTLVMQNVELSYKTAEKYIEKFNIHQHEAEVITHANQGICNALVNYDFTQGYRFSLTVPYYIKNNIENNIEKYISKQYKPKNTNKVSYTKQDLPNLAKKGETKKILSLLNHDNNDFDSEKLIYKWLYITLDYGYKYANNAIKDLLENSEFRYDDDKIEQKKIHLELMLDYANNKNQFPFDIDLCKKHMHLAIKYMCNTEELLYTLKKIKDTTIKEKLEKEINLL